MKGELLFVLLFLALEFLVLVGEGVKRSAKNDGGNDDANDDNCERIHTSSE